MAIKLILLLFLPVTLMAQIKLHPFVGVTFLNNKMVTPAQYVTPWNNLPNDFEGFEIEKSFGKNKLSFNLTFNEIWLQATVNGIYPTTNTSWGWSTFGRSVSTGTNLYLFGLRYYREVWDVKKTEITKHRDDGEFVLLNEQYKKKTRYLFNFVWSPFVGVAYNRVDKNTNWDGYPPDSSRVVTSPNTLNIGSSSDFTYIKYGNGDKVVKNYNGVSLQLGFRFQFRKKDKERLAVTFVYNQGLTQLLYSPFEYYIAEIDHTVKSAFMSRGTSWGIAMSYPITLVNKKGERRKDRKN